MNNKNEIKLNLKDEIEKLNTFVNGRSVHVYSIDSKQVKVESFEFTIEKDTQFILEDDKHLYISGYLIGADIDSIQYKSNNNIILYCKIEEFNEIKRFKIGIDIISK